MGSMAMYLLLLIRYKTFHFNRKKIPNLLFFLFLAGYFGTKILFVIENGYYNGQSYYGAVFFVPIVFLFISPYYEIGYGKILSYCAPCGCLIHIFMKVGCLLSGCCEGSTFYSSFCIIPLQVLEGAMSLVILLLLITLENENQRKHYMYGWYMILQGIVRFILNFFRDDLSIFFLLPAGHLWSLVSFVTGLVYLKYYIQINAYADKFGAQIRKTIAETF